MNEQQLATMREMWLAGKTIEEVADYTTQIVGMHPILLAPALHAAFGCRCVELMKFANLYCEGMERAAVSEALTSKIQSCWQS